MKKILLVIIALTITKASFAQWQDGANIYNTNAGNVGIGTASPAGKLTVKTIGSSLEFNTDASAGSILSYDRTNILYKKLGFRGSNFGFLVNDIEKVTIDVNGNVGIGKLTPLATLDVNGVVRVTGPSSNLDVKTIWGNLSNLANSGQMLIGWNRFAGKRRSGFHS